mgnify:CR=1 FL=1
MAKDGFMDLDSLALLRNSSPSWKLLASDDAAFCCSFFYHEFLENNVRNLSEARLVLDMRTALSEKHSLAGEDIPDEEELREEARFYLRKWSDEDHRWLRRFYRDHQTFYDLTTAGQKAVEWLESLKSRSFIGTESRLHTFFHLLHEIEHQANPDKEERLKYLTAQKKEINRKIQDLKAGGKVDVLDDVQIKERFMEAMDIAGGILSDFREVKDKFHQIYTEFRDEVNEWEHGKGALLEQFIADREVIEESEQGKSFTAFFDYLMAFSQQRDFDETMRKILTLKALSQETDRYDALHIKQAWVDGAEDVQQTIAKLSEQISWYVNENNLQEKKNIYFQIKEIEKKAMAMKGREPKEKNFMTLSDGAPTISLPMERTLRMPPAKMELDAHALEIGEHHGSLDAIFNQVYVDKKVLKEHIEDMLETWGPVTLKDVLDAYPLEKGLFELLAYMEIAKSEHHTFLPEKDRIPFKGIDGRERYVEMDRIVFEKGKNHG